jgi:hypothetical protein
VPSADGHGESYPNLLILQTYVPLLEEGERVLRLAESEHCPLALGGIAARTYYLDEQGHAFVLGKLAE